MLNYYLKELPKLKFKLIFHSRRMNKKSLQDKIQEDFGSPNVGMSGGDTNIEEDDKLIL